jgi:uncharacterized protein Yka (UPF0111/DUF47 family)
MSGVELTSSEKASLSDLARKLVEKSERRAVEIAQSQGKVSEIDYFTKDGQLQRMIELEKKIDSMQSEWARNLNSIMFAVERLEARVSRIDGELEGLHEKEEKLEKSVELHKNNLIDSASAFAEEAARKLEEAIDKVDTFLSRPHTGEKLSTTATEEDIITRG